MNCYFLDSTTPYTFVFIGSNDRKFIVCSLHGKASKYMCQCIYKHCRWRLDGNFCELRKARWSVVSNIGRQSIKMANVKSEQLHIVGSQLIILTLELQKAFIWLLFVSKYSHNDNDSSKRLGKAISIEFFNILKKDLILSWYHDTAVLSMTLSFACVTFLCSTTYWNILQRTLILPFMIIFRNHEKYSSNEAW